MCMIIFCKEQLRIVKHPGLIWSQHHNGLAKLSINYHTLPPTAAEFNFHGLNITKITQKWIHSCGLSKWWQRTTFAHCNFVLYCLTNSCLQKKIKRRYRIHFIYMDIMWHPYLYRNVLKRNIQTWKDNVSFFYEFIKIMKTFC